MRADGTLKRLSRIRLRAFRDEFKIHSAVIVHPSFDDATFDIVRYFFGGAQGRSKRLVIP